MKRIIRKVATGCLFAGLVLAMPAWGQGYVRFNVDPNDPLRCEVSFISRHANTNDIHLYLARYSPGEPGSDHTGFHTYHSRSYGHATEPQTVSCGRFIWNKLHRATIRVGYWSLYHRINFYTDTYTPRETETPTEPETPESETPTEPGTPGPTSQTCTYEHRLIGVPGTTGGGYTGQILINSKDSNATATIRAYQYDNGHPIDVLDSEGSAIGSTVSLAPAHSVKMFRLESAQGWHSVIVEHPSARAMRRATVVMRFREPGGGVSFMPADRIEDCETAGTNTE